MLTLFSNAMLILTNENEEIKKVIIQLFDAMRSANKLRLKQYLG